MNADEVKAFWEKWLDAEQAGRLDKDRLESIRQSGNRAIDDDPEYWQKTSMWSLFDTVVVELN